MSEQAECHAATRYRTWNICDSERRLGSLGYYAPRLSLTRRTETQAKPGNVENRSMLSGKKVEIKLATDMEIGLL
jgi:hypothetical protein